MKKKLVIIVVVIVINIGGYFVLVQSIEGKSGFKERIDEEINLSAQASLQTRVSLSEIFDTVI